MDWSRTMLTVVIVMAACSAALADEGDYDDASFQHTIQAGKRFQIGDARSWNPACQSTGATYRITQGPAHGSLSQDKIASAIPEGRGECSGRPATMTRLFYTPSSSFQGEERISYDEIFGNGGHRHVDEDLTVVGPHIAVHEGQILRTMPAPGTLEGPPGMSVYVADRSCPAGEIKRLVLGSVSQGIPRTVSCVAR